MIKLRENLEVKYRLVKPTRAIFVDNLHVRPPLTPDQIINVNDGSVSEVHSM